MHGLNLHSRMKLVLEYTNLPANFCQVSDCDMKQINFWSMPLLTIKMYLHIIKQTSCMYFYQRTIDKCYKYVHTNSIKIQ